MQINKEYRPILCKRTDFCDVNSNNSAMLTMIDEHGGSFTVLHMSSASYGTYADEVQMKDGTYFSSNDSDYFEISEEEFQYFEEVEVTPSFEAVEGVNSINITVTPDNSGEMIKLLETLFK